MTSPHMPDRNLEPDQQVRRTNLGQMMVTDALNVGEMPVITVPRITLDTNLPLRWGEWFGIAISTGLGMALLFQAFFLIATLIWYGDTRHVLLSFGPLLLTIAVAAFTMRLAEAVATLRRFSMVFLVAGVIISSLLLTRTQVFPALAPGDWSWLKTFADLASLDDPTPHAILGMILVSAFIWIFALNLAQNGGDYIARRDAFLRLFALLIVALVIGLFAVSDTLTFSEDVALYLPAYTLCGLITLSQVRLVEVRLQMTRTGAGGKRAFTIWRLVTVGLALASILAVFLVTAIFYGGAYAQLIAESFTVWGHIADFLANIIVWLTLPLVQLLALLRHPQTFSMTVPKGCVIMPTAAPTGSPTPTITATPVTSPTPEPTPILPCNQQSTNPLFKGAGPISPADAHLIFAIFLIAVALVSAILLFLRTRRALGMTKASEYEEERERLDRRELRQARVADASGIGAGDMPAPGTARAAYQAFLRASATAQLPREPTETPAEFEERVKPEMGDAALETTVEDLTQGYEAERYGAERLPPARLTGLQAAARAIAAAFERLRSQRKPRT